MEKKLDIIQKKVFFYSFSLSFILLITFGVIKYPDWWLWISEDDSPTSFLQVIYLYSCFALGILISIIHYLDKNIDIKEKFTFELASFGFLLLTIESKYEFHNQIRRVLEVNKDFPVFLWFKRGDFVLTSILIIGLIFSFFFIKYLKKNKNAFLFFILGAFMSIFSIGIDSFHLDNFFAISENLEFCLEEIGEIIAALFFLNSFFSMLCFYLNNFLNSIQSENK